MMDNELTNTELPAIVQVLQTINRREILPDQVDWVKYLSEVVTLRRLMNKSVTDIQMLWMFVATVDDYRTRMNIFEAWQDVASKCFQTQSERDEFYANCGCLYRTAQVLYGEVNRHAIQLPQVYSGEGTKSLNELAYIWSDGHATGIDMVSLAQEIFERVTISNENGVSELSMLLSSRRVHHNRFHNCNTFCRLLCCAEFVRQRVITGQLNTEPVYNPFRMKRKLLQESFDAYISLRINEIAAMMEEDYERVIEPEEKDYYAYLYDEESSVANREFMFEEFHGSQAYCDQWYDSRPEVLQLMQLFMEYLKSEKEKKEKATDKQVIVNNGDYVAGDKITGDVIKHVEAGGIGKQVIYGKQESANTINETKQQEANPAQESEPIEPFKYIHYEIVDEKERICIHKQICNIVRLPKMTQICSALSELRKDKKILATIEQSAMLAELRRLGMPADQQGFSDQNFYSFYTK